MTWVENEMELADFGDKRLNQRAITLLERFISQPPASIPTACRGWKETLAAYRFFDNAKVSDANILAPHIAATRQRMQKLLNKPVRLTGSFVPAMIAACWTTVA